MIRCHKCNSTMVKVELIDLWGRKSEAMVCTYEGCGHIYTRDRVFRRKPKKQRSA
ncbi:MAG TPA: hypothetical protein GX526_01075 [Thermoanaerobacterales bacterium]|nr:hypothetical protein [Thermoanaerobacterales bacterium]